MAKNELIEALKQSTLERIKEKDDMAAAIRLRLTADRMQRKKEATAHRSNVMIRVSCEDHHADCSLQLFQMRPMGVCRIRLLIIVLIITRRSRSGWQQNKSCLRNSR